jgi:hypothetical protein
MVSMVDGRCLSTSCMMEDQDNIDVKKVDASQSVSLYQLFIESITAV